MRYVPFGWRGQDWDPSARVVVAKAGETYHGTEYDDRHTGTSGDDFLYGMGGDDLLNGSKGSDHLEGGAGDDHLVGGQGYNTLLGGDGDDLVRSNFYDVADGGADDDRLAISYSYAGSNTFVLNVDRSITSTHGTYSNFESFSLNFKHGGNTIALGDGDDSIKVGETGNHVQAGGGDDRIHVAGMYSGLDVDGGSGYDVLYMTTKERGSFDDAAFLATIDGPNSHVSGVEHYDITEAYDFDGTIYRLTTGGAFDIFAPFIYDRFYIDASKQTEGLTITFRQDAETGYLSDVTFLDTKLVSNAGAEVHLSGSAFADRIEFDDVGINYNQVFDGGAGIDTLKLDLTGAQSLICGDGTITGYETKLLNFEVFELTTGAGSSIHGSTYDDTLGINDDGTAASQLYGGKGDDRLSGGRGDDTLSGGAGDDVATGGAGADRFLIASVANIRAGGDVIADFHSAEHDLIDLSAIDTSKEAGDQAFRFIGADAFSGTRGAWELRASDAGGGAYLVEIDKNHDGAADFSLTVRADQPLAATDFVL